MMRRAAIELSSTFIIVLIISLVVFASGIAIAYRVMHKADEYSGEIDRETEQRIEDILAPGERVALPIDRKPLRIGKSHVFGLGIFNMLGAEQEFEVRMSFHKAIDAAANADIAPQGISAADIKDYINKNLFLAGQRDTPSEIMTRKRFLLL